MSSAVSDALLNGLTWRQLARVQRATGWSDQDLANRLGYTLREFYRKRVGKKPLLAISTIKLAEELKVDLAQLVFGKVDFHALERHYHGDADYLPERYHTGAFSRMRTSLHLLSYCDNHLGEGVTDRLLRSFQLKRAAFANPDRFISIRFLVDACEHLARFHGAGPEVFKKIGMQSAEVNRGSPMSALLKQCKSVRELYDLQINTLMGFYDKNFRYRTITLTVDSCIIESLEDPQVKDTYQGAKIGSPLTCQTRVGVAAAIAGVLDLPFAAVQKTHCIHSGDSRCLFSVDFRHANAQLGRVVRPSLHLFTQPLVETPLLSR